MTTTPYNVFIDADVFVALLRPNDTNHRKALRLFGFLVEKEVFFYTSNYVFTESVTVISQRVGKDAAHQFIESFQAKESPFSIIWITPPIQEVALDIFKKQASKNVSLVDCANMAIMRSQTFDAIFSFDKTYKTNHIPLVEDLV